MKETPGAKVTGFPKLLLSKNGTQTGTNHPCFGIFPTITSQETILPDDEKTKMAGNYSEDSQGSHTHHLNKQQP